MRIVFLSHTTSLYGANRSLLALIEGLIALNVGVECIVITPAEGKFSKELQRLKVEYHIVPYQITVYTANTLSWVMSVKRQFKNLIIYHSFKQKIKRLEVDIIYSNSSVLHMGAYIAHDLALPHFWHIREFGMLDYQQKFDFGRKNFEKWLNRAEGIIAISTKIKEEVLYNIQTPIYQVYNGVLQKSEFTLPDFSRKKTFVFCIVGSLQEGKGQLDALMAFSKLSTRTINTIELWIVGDGDETYTKLLKSYVAEQELSNQVTFLGYIQKPIEVMKKAHIGLMCSKNEAMGRVTAEYMACGLPVIGYRGGATPEIVEHGKTGLLYQNNLELKNAMEKLIHDEALYETMARNAYKTALATYSIENYAASIFQILQNSHAD